MFKSGIQSTLNEGNLYHFLEEHGNNRLKSELIYFWGNHPDTKFTRDIICYALDCSKLEAEKALEEMEDDGLVDDQDDNGSMFYFLTKEEEKRRPVMELAALSYDDWYSMINYIQHKNGV